MSDDESNAQKQPPPWFDVQSETYRAACSSPRRSFYGFVGSCLIAAVAGLGFLYYCHDAIVLYLWWAATLALCFAIHFALTEIHRRKCQTELLLQVLRDLVRRARDHRERTPPTTPAEKP